MAIIDRVRIVWSGVAGSPAYSNLYTVTGESDPSEFHTSVKSLTASLVNVCSTSVTARVDPNVARIDSASGDILSEQSFVGQNYTGLGGAGMLPPATQMVARFLTDTYVGGRRVRGRMYIPYLYPGVNGNGRPAGTWPQDIQNYFSAFLTAAEGWCVWAKTSGTAPKITSTSVWDQFGTMRSRRD